PGGELHASDSSWSKELVAHRQPTSGTEGCGDSLGRGKLPSARSPGARLLFHDSPRACRSPDPASPRIHPRCLGRAVFVKPWRTAQKFSSSITSSTNILLVNARCFPSGEGTMDMMFPAGNSCKTLKL